MTFDRPIIVIAGPTASGKSSMALQLAKDINGVIINADSRQIYKELNIGTAKPVPDRILNSKEWVIDDIPHFLYGFLPIKEKYNIFQYQKDVQEVFDNLSDDKTPILVGGTGLYIDSIVFNYHLSSDSGIQNNLTGLTVKELQNMLDPEIVLNESDRNNPVRLVRILEKGNSEQKKGPELNHKYFVLDIDKDGLRDRIEERVDQMFKDGLLEENQELFKSTTVLKTIGYAEFTKYFNKQISLDEVRSNIVTNTSKYAKRQRTWFRKNKKAVYVTDYNYLLTESLKLINT